MSIFKSLTTATAGINAQSTAFTNLSNNIANSQTVGYKASETSFQDFVSNSLSTPSTQAVSDGVGAVTTSQTQQQGTISTSTNALAVAISGNGFFDVSEASGQSTAGTESFSNQQYFTRNGDFSTDKNGYLVNTSGYYLDGYQADPTTGTLGTDLTQLNVSNIAFRPTQTTTLTMSGSAPAAASITDSTDSTTTPANVSTIYDSEGAAHQVAVTWTSEDPTTIGDTTTGDTVYNVTMAAYPTGTTDMTVGKTENYTVTFDSSGDIKSVQYGAGSTDASGASLSGDVGTPYTGATAAMPFTVTYTDPTTGSTTSQSISLNIGTIGSDSGMTSSTSSSSVALTSDSATSATYEGIEMQSDGSVLAEFSNGDTQLVGKIALSSFKNADGLMAVDGQAYVATSASGSATTGMVGANGTGSLETSSTESSTTDLTSDLSNLIVTQEAYSANTKVVTTADTLLQDTIGMIR